jgi:iron complex outermembrane receptor protein
LRSIPGITAEGGGGENAVNIFVRGMPSGGQNDFTPIQFDGFSLAGYGLSSTAGDVYARVDQGISALEFVRGGASILYGTGSTAGIINYISKTGDRNAENIVNLEYADEGRTKAEFYSGGQLGGDDSNTYYAFSGWLRKDDGPYDFGLPSKGFQFRGNIKKKFDNGSFTLYGQFINDKAQFIMPLPLSGGSRERLRGNDGREVTQLNSSHLRNISFLTPAGEYRSPIEEGVYTRGHYVMGDFKYNLEDDWNVKAKLKYSNYVSDFALYIGGNGAEPFPITLDDYVATLPGATTAYSATFSGGDGSQISGSDLVIDNLHIDRHRPVTDYVGELSIQKKLIAGDATHNFTAGMYMSYSEGEDINYQFRTLSEFNQEPQLINLSYTNASGNNVIFSEGGLTNRVGLTANRFLTQERTAFYFTDEIVMDRWRIDAGFRIESNKGIREDGAISSAPVYENLELTGALQNVNYTTGEFTRASVSDTDWAASLAVLYKVDDELNLYINGSKGYFFPLIRNFTPVSNGVMNSRYNSEQIYQVEGGLKYGTNDVSFTFAGYYTTLRDRISTQRADIVGIGLIEARRNEQNTRTFGVEASWDWKFAENFAFSGNATYQNHELTQNVTTDLVSGTTTDGNTTLVEGNSVTENEGNELQRQPNFLSTLRLDYDDGNFDAFASAVMRDKVFANIQNTVELDGYAIFRIGAGYSFAFEDTKELRLGFSVFNLFNTDKLTEGNPRDLDQQTDSDFFFGRPILPRRLFFNVSFNF